MKSYYTGSDIQEFAARGIKRLEMGPEVVITDVGRELAEQLGMELIAVGAAPREEVRAIQGRTPTASAARPRGCQHGPLIGTSEAGSARAGFTPSKQDEVDGMVDSLVDIISGLTDHGG